ncbi:FimV/HubP family polar landmark protein [Eikenella corrodens]|nr:FimV/HubP family polar landmark protein [Eikenella corrodens]
MKLIAASLGLAASVGAHAALGGLQVQSRLNEPFSATVVVTGDEARALASAKPTINGADLQATVSRRSGDRAVIRLHSRTPIKEPVMTFWLGVGNQNHQYTAMLDPRDYHASGSARSRHERRAEAEPGRRHSAESRRHRRAADRREAPVQISGESYQIKDGELLVDIAQRVKPVGMTLRQTINALVAANPRAFRNGNPDLMYRGATLTIPDGDTLRRLAHNPPRRLSTRAQEERPAADTAPTRQQPQVEAQPTPPVTPPAPPAPPVEPTQPQPQQPQQQAQPQQPAQPPVQQPPQGQQPAVPPMASDAVPETPASAALPDMGVSQPEQASDMMASEPVVETPPVEVAPPVVETPPMEEEGMDITQMVLYGGGGLLALGGLAYLLMNRRRKGAAPARGDDHEDDDDGLYFENVTDHSDSLSATPAAPAAAAPVSQSAAPAAAQPATVSEQDLGLDLSYLDEQQQLGSTPSTEAAARQAEADDWSWLEESEQPAAASDDDWLNFAAEEPAPAQAPVQPVPEPQAAPVAPEELDWVLDETPATQTFQAEAPAAVEVAEPAKPAAPEMDNTIAFDVSSLDTESVSSVAKEAAAPAAASNVMDFNLDFDSTPAAPAQAAPAEVSQPAPAARTEPVSAAPLPKEALEAKLELAKMYLEIDDANTARQTLMELINESEGSSIQAEAQQLLNDIGR